MVDLLTLLSYVTIQGRWRRTARLLNLGLNIVLAGLVLSFAVSGNIFLSGVRDVLALVAAVYIPCVGVQLYGEIGRVDHADTPPPGQ